MARRGDLPAGHFYRPGASGWPCRWKRCSPTTRRRWPEMAEPCRMLRWTSCPRASPSRCALADWLGGLRATADDERCRLLLDSRQPGRGPKLQASASWCRLDRARRRRTWRADRSRSRIVGKAGSVTPRSSALAGPGLVGGAAGCRQEAGPAVAAVALQRPWPWLGRRAAMQAEHQLRRAGAGSPRAACCEDKRPGFTASSASATA